MAKKSKGKKCTGANGKKVNCARSRAAKKAARTRKRRGS